MPVTKTEILQGRNILEGYRNAHIALYSSGWYKGISDAHTPLFAKLKKDLKLLGFDSLVAFFSVSKAQYKLDGEKGEG